jgi:hypothetical protein
MAALDMIKVECPLCRILSRLSKLPNTARVKLRNMHPFIRVSSGPDNNKKDIAFGLPKPLESGSSEFFWLLQQWLSMCDDGCCTYEHGTCRPTGDGVLPTRLVEVGDYGQGPDYVRLVYTAQDALHDMRYIALSHRWGKVPETGFPWCTTQENEDVRRTHGFLIRKLPKTFIDAITVCRELHVRYLWVDSLCIVQGLGGDWDAESSRMHNVFRNAYCTIAATSCQDSMAGFLQRSLEAWISTRMWMVLTAY